jgi:hypothetical protein
VSLPLPEGDASEADELVSRHCGRVGFQRPRETVAPPRSHGTRGGTPRGRSFIAPALSMNVRLHLSA